LSGTLSNGALFFLLSLDLLEGCQEAIQKCVLNYEGFLGDFLETAHPPAESRIEMQDRNWKKLREKVKERGGQPDFQEYDFYKTFFEKTKFNVESYIINKLGGNAKDWAAFVKAKKEGEEDAEANPDVAYNQAKKDLRDERARYEGAVKIPKSNSKNNDVLTEFLAKLYSMLGESRKIVNRMDQKRKQNELKMLTEEFVKENKFLVQDYIQDFCSNFKLNDVNKLQLYLIYFIALAYAYFYKDGSLFKLCKNISLKYKVFDELYSKMDIDRVTV